MEVETIGAVHVGWISTTQGCDPLTAGLTGIVGLIKIDLRLAEGLDDDGVILSTSADEATQIMGWMGKKVTIGEVIGVKGDAPDTETTELTEGVDVSVHIGF